MKAVSDTIAIYLRISDEDGKTGESESITGQRDFINNYIKSDAILSSYAQVEMSDDGYSGTNFNRPGVMELFESVRSGEVTIVIVKDISRFGRNYLEVGHYLEQIFPFLGVRFISINDRYDSATNDRNFDFMGLGFQNLIYDLYSKDLSQKIISVRQAKAKQGKFITAYAPYGYKKTKEQQLVIDEEAAVIVRRIFDLALAGTPKAHIARMLNAEDVPSPLMLRKARNDNLPCYHVEEKCIWKTSAISAILKDRRYVGDAVYGKVKPTKVGSGVDRPVPQEEWIIVENTHEAIITRELFEETGTLFGKRNYTRSAELRPLQGKIRCGSCNHVLSPVKRNGKVTYLCKTPDLATGYSCYRDSLVESDLEEIIANYLGKLSASICDFENQSKEDDNNNLLKLNNELKAAQTQLAKIQVAKFALYESYKDGKTDKETYLKKKADFEKSAEKIITKQDIVTEELQTMRIKTSEDEKCVEVIKRYMPFGEITREIAETFIDEIVVKSDGRVKISWKFANIK